MSKRVKIIRPKKVIEPLFWTPVDRQAFPAWVTKTFLEYQVTKETLKEQKPSGVFEPTNIQKLVKAYMAENSPYRGILLYHKLGSGKTCSAIGISENLNIFQNHLLFIVYIKDLCISLKT